MWLLHLLWLFLFPVFSYVLPTPRLLLLLASTSTLLVWCSRYFPVLLWRVLRHRSLVHFLSVKCLLRPCLIKFIRNSLLEVKFLRTWSKSLFFRNR